MTRLSDGKHWYQLGERLAGGRGGQGSVYHLIDRPQWVAKLYHESQLQNHERMASYERKICAMCATIPPTVYDGSHVNFAWPHKALYDEGKFVGFTMPLIENREAVKALIAYTNQPQLAPAWRRWDILLKAAHHFAALVEELHANKIIVGDINEENLLIHSSGKVSILDCDSFQLRRNGETFVAEFGRDEFTPPELAQAGTVRNRSCASDNFSLAVMIFRLLMDGVHPFAVKLEAHSELSNNPRENILRGACSIAHPESYAPPDHMPPLSRLPPYLLVLFKQCFGRSLKQPRRRPTAKAWRLALGRLREQLNHCERCDRDYWQRGSCPYCPSRQPSKLRQGLAAFPRELSGQLSRWLLGHIKGWRQTHQQDFYDAVYSLKLVIVLSLGYLVIHLLAHGLTLFNTVSVALILVFLLLMSRLRRRL